MGTVSRVLGLLFLIAPVVLRAQDVTGTLRGIVRNETGRPIEHALVVLDPTSGRRETRTDRDGQFSFLGVTPGAHALRVTFVGYRPQDRTVDAARGVVDIDVTLEGLVQVLTGVEVTATRSGLFGSVIAKDSLLPVPDARIEVLGGRTSDTTGSDGVFNFPLLKPGSYLVRVRHSQFASRVQSIVVPEKGGTQLDLVVERGLLSRDAHMEQLYRELDSRVHWMGTTAAMISREELKGGLMTTLDAALPGSVSFMKAGFYPAREGWEGACLFVDGVARPGMTISNFAIEEIEAIELYGPPLNRSDPTGTLASRWPAKAMCGMSMGPSVPFERGGSGSSVHLSPNAIRVAFVVIWRRLR